MEHCENPKDGGECHRAKDDDLHLVLHVEVLDVFDEFGEHREPHKLAFRDEVGPEYGGEGEGVNDDSRAFSEDDADPAWEGQSAFCHIYKANAHEPLKEKYVKRAT